MKRHPRYLPVYTPNFFRKKFVNWGENCAKKPWNNHLNVLSIHGFHYIWAS